MKQTVVSDQTVTGYDIIGDIHGCAGVLVRLLEKLDYRRQSGVFRHPERRVIFLGDLIDRGPEIRDTIMLVRAMVEAGSAHMVLGNHEYAAITHSTPAPEGFGRPFLKPHTSRLKRMLAETLNEFEGREDEWQSIVAWWRTLPLYLEFDNFRVVHACWDDDKIARLNELAPAHNLVDDNFLINSVQPGTTENRIVERLLKGTDMPLPEGMTIRSADGLTRDRFRTKFWKAQPQTYSDIVFQPDRIPDHLLRKKLSDSERRRLVHYEASERPLFVGHYWRRGQPRLIRNNIACLDYGAVNRGKLVAYRIDKADKSLDEDRLVWVSA